MVPKKILTRSGPISLNTARPVNTVQPRTIVNNAIPMKNVINNIYSTARRPFNKITAANNSNFTKKVNTVKETRVNTARPKAVLSAVKGNKRNAVKALACWVCRPKHKVLDHQDLKDKGVIDSGCSRHMTGNRSYLTDYVGNPLSLHFNKINKKIRKNVERESRETSKLDFKDVYFVKELKFNLFSVSQMCDKKNSVLFTDTECVVLSPDFKLTDESHVLLKVPRKDNMYSVDLKNVVPQGGLTCLFAKATPDESNLWHRRLGHVNFKTMNKLVRGSLVRGLPSKPFEINQTCVAYQKGKQHRASYRLGKFNGKADEGFFVGYSTNSKAFRVFNNRTRIVEENLHVQFSTKACNDVGKARMEIVPGKYYILLPMWPSDLLFSQDLKSSPDTGFKPSREEEKKDAEDLGNESGNPTEGKDSEVPSKEESRVNQEKDVSVNSTNTINTISPTVYAASIEDNAVDENIV
ncbi:ribonuclease H-like domain-containing protein [Tanacetum coccineum]